MSNAFRFPSDFKRLIKNLGDENQWRILECIINNDNKVKYSGIQKKIVIPKGTLNYHLKELQKGGWIRRWSQKGTIDEEGSYYEINQFGMKILEGGLKALDETSYQQSYWDEILQPQDFQIIKTQHPSLKSELPGNSKTRQIVEGFRSRTVFSILSSADEINADSIFDKSAITTASVLQQFIRMTLHNDTSLEIPKSNRRKTLVWT